MKVYELNCPAGIRIAFIALGGAIVAIDVPDRDGLIANVALGHRDLELYRSQRVFFGCVVGRYANRVADARFDLDGRRYHLEPTDGTSAVHGGLAGFDKAEWTVTLGNDAEAEFAVLTHVSPDGDQGYPGTLLVRMTYRLGRDGDFSIDYEATTDKPTIVNLTNHSYFNLAGEGSGDVLGHVVEIAAGRYTPSDAILIPTGEIASVAGTPFDFTSPQPIGSRIRQPHPQIVAGFGYDVNYVLEGEGVRFACRVVEPGSGRTLEIETSAPGIQFYTGNLLDGTMVGPSGRTYRQSDGFCFEPHHFPNTPNIASFPSARLDPGETYRSTTVYRFGPRRSLADRGAGLTSDNPEAR